MDSAEYVPDAAVLAHLPAVDFVAIIGPTAAGKTTLLNAAIARDATIHLVVVTTNRARRPGEQNDIDYHFRTEAEMRDRIARKGFVQVAPSVLGSLYATAPEDYTTNGISVMAVLVDGMVTFLSLPFKRLRQIYVLPPRWPEWQNRIKAHSFTPEQIAKRMQEARRSLEYAAGSSDVLFIRNDDREDAVNEMLRILQGGTSRLSEGTGRRYALELLKQLRKT